jgi:hypothetical protein
MTRFYPYPFFSDNSFVLPVGLPLWQEDGSVTYSAIADWSGHWGPITIRYCLICDCSIFVASYDSQGLRWRYYNSPPHGEEHTLNLAICMRILYVCLYWALGLGKCWHYRHIFGWFTNWLQRHWRHNNLEHERTWIERNIRVGSLGCKSFQNHGMKLIWIANVNFYSFLKFRVCLVFKWYCQQIFCGQIVTVILKWPLYVGSIVYF